jgi:hypothetical protein
MTLLGARFGGSTVGVTAVDTRRIGDRTGGHAFLSGSIAQERRGSPGVAHLSEDMGS